MVGWPHGTFKMPQKNGWYLQLDGLQTIIVGDSKWLALNQWSKWWVKTHGFQWENQSYITCLWFSEWFPVKSGSNLGVLYTQKLLVATHEVGNRPTSSNQRQTASWCFLSWLATRNTTTVINTYRHYWLTNPCYSWFLLNWCSILFTYWLYTVCTTILNLSGPSFFRLKNGVFQFCLPMAGSWSMALYRPRDCPQKYKPNLNSTTKWD